MTMSSSRCLFAVFALLFSVTASSAQGLFFGNQYDSLLFQQRIVSMDEFMDRFNGEDVKGLDNMDTLARMKCLYHVCNHDALEKEPERWYSFLSDLARDSTRLSYTYANWAAIATCMVDVDGTEDTVTLILKMEHVKRSIYKWVITQASGRLLSLSPEMASTTFAISPTDNDVDFISLGEITGKNGQNILCYSNRDFLLDQTSVFFSLVAMGYLKIKYVADLDYQFDVPHYTFFVEHFSRETSNAGWLISDFFETDVPSQDLNMGEDSNNE